jgi:hypothetical protein
MDNRITAGTEMLPRNNIKKSIIELPINEDWCCLFVMLEKVTDKIIRCKKLWDNSTNPKNYYIFCYSGNTPKLDSKLVAYRCGDYNNIGSDFPELHEENQNGHSWITFGFIPNTFVRDKGNSTGIACKFNANKSITEFGEIKAIATVDTALQYHNCNPPHKENRIYFAQNSSDGWLVWLPGFGDEAYTPEVEIDATTKIKLHCDNQGNVLDMTAESEPSQNDFVVKDIKNWWSAEAIDHDARAYANLFYVYADTMGEELGLSVERKEIEVWDEGFSNHLTTLIKTETAGRVGASIQSYPLKYELDFESDPMPAGIYPSDFFMPGKFLAYTPPPPTNIMEMPGSGVYPPPGQLASNKKIQYKIREFLADGTTRVTVQDDEVTDFATSAGITPAHVPHYSGHLKISVDTNYFYLWWRGKFFPHEEGFSKFRCYLYRENVANEWYLHGTIAREAIKSNRFGGSFAFPRKRTYWGVPFDGSSYPNGYYKINKFYLVAPDYHGQEMWVGPFNASPQKVLKD